MSSTPSESEFDLEKLFLPAWAQGSPTVNKYASFAGDDRPPREHGERPGGRRPPRRDFGQQGGRPQGSGGRPQGGGHPSDRQSRPGGPRPGGPRQDGFRERSNNGPIRREPE